MIKLWEIYLLKFKLFSFPQLLNVRLRIFLKSNLSLNMNIFVFIILIKFKKFKKIKMIKMIKLLLIKLNQLHLSNYFTFVWNLKLNRNWICCFHFWKVIANQNVLFSFLQEVIGNMDFVIDMIAKVGERSDFFYCCFGT